MFPRKWGRASGWFLPSRPHPKTASVCVLSYGTQYCLLSYVGLLVPCVCVCVCVRQVTCSTFRCCIIMRAFCWTTMRIPQMMMMMTKFVFWSSVAAETVSRLERISTDIWRCWHYARTDGVTQTRWRARCVQFSTSRKWIYRENVGVSFLNIFLNVQEKVGLIYRWLYDVRKWIDHETII